MTPADTAPSARISSAYLIDRTETYPEHRDKVLIGLQLAEAEELFQSTTQWIKFEKRINGGDRIHEVGGALRIRGEPDDVHVLPICEHSVGHR
jgi:hypothetical protein